MKTGLTVGQKTNAGFGDFIPVTLAVGSRIFGVDVYLGTGKATEPGAVVSRELSDWQDGDGLLANQYANEREVWEAVDE